MKIRYINDISLRYMLHIFMIKTISSLKHISLEFFSHSLRQIETFVEVVISKKVYMLIREVIT